MVEKTTLARPYAHAIFELACEQGRLRDWSEHLRLMAAAASDAEFRARLDDPRISRTRRAELFIAVCGDALDEHARNLVRVLAHNHRLPVLPEIAARYEALRTEREGHLRAQIISAYPLSAAQREEIAAALKMRLGREVDLECGTDKSLLGGVVIRAGDLVIDGSVRGRLEQLARVLNQ